VDLTDVTFIDKSGEKALAELSKEGAKLIATVVTPGTSCTTSRGKVESSTVRKGERHE